MTTLTASERVALTDDASDDVHGRKRGRTSSINAQAGPSPKKRKKGVMSAFETPHPTLEGQSQAFKLPSSKPQYSPTFSPVPNTTGQTLSPPVELPDDHKAANRTTSRNLKENAENRPRFRSGKSHRQSSRTLVSVTLTSGGIVPPTTNLRSKRRQSRSTSRSSTSSRSRASSRDSRPPHTHKARSSRASLPVPTLQTTGQANPPKLDLLTLPKSQPKSKSKSKAKPKLVFSASSPVAPALLASPFVSRASSPVEFPKERREVKVKYKSKASMKKAHISTQKPAFSEAEEDNRRMNMAPPLAPGAAHKNDMKRVLADTFFDPNVPTQHRHMRGRPSNVAGMKKKNTQTQSLSVNASPTSHHPTSGRENEVPVRQQEGKPPAWKDRRTSAPSALTRPRPKAKPVVPARLSSHGVIAKRATSTKYPESGQSNSHLPSPGLVKNIDTRALLPPTPPAAEGELRHGYESDADPFKWMHARQDVDFNRPPSQMSMVLGSFDLDVEIDAIGTTGWGCGDEVFWSSSEGEDEDEDEREIVQMSRKKLVADSRVLEDATHLGFEGFAEEVHGASTPFANHKGLVKAQSLPTLHSDLDVDVRRKMAGKARTMSMTTALHAGLAADEDNDNGGEEDMEFTDPVDGTQLAFAEDKTTATSRHNSKYNSWVTDSIISPPTIYRVGRKESHDDEEVDEEESLSSSLLHSRSRARQEAPDMEMVLPERQLSSPFRLDYCSTSSSSSDSLDQQDENHDQGQQPEEQEERAEGTTNDKETRPAAKRTRSGTIVPTKSIAAPAVISTAARRTRTGTIVGPLPPTSAAGGSSRRSRSGTILAGSNSLLSVERASNAVNIGEARRTRSGTIVAANAGSSNGGIRGRVRSGSVLAGQGMPEGKHPQGDEPKTPESINRSLVVGDNPHIAECERDADADAEPQPGADADVEGFADSLYVPRLTSSPDPIDFLRFSRIVEDEEDQFVFALGTTSSQTASATAGGSNHALSGVKEMTWCVADEPPSPEIIRKRDVRPVTATGGILRSKARRGRAVSGGRMKSRTSGGKARFAVVVPKDGDLVEVDEGAGEEDNLSDDELLLVDGSTTELLL